MERPNDQRSATALLTMRLRGQESLLSASTYQNWFIRKLCDHNCKLQDRIGSMALKMTEVPGNSAS